MIVNIAWSKKLAQKYLEQIKESDSFLAVDVERCAQITR